jgi:hypothetical protein
MRSFLRVIKEVDMGWRTCGFSRTPGPFELVLVKIML